MLNHLWMIPLYFFGIIHMLSYMWWSWLTRYLIISTAYLFYHLSLWLYWPEIEAHQKLLRLAQGDAPLDRVEGGTWVFSVEVTTGAKRRNRREMVNFLWKIWWNPNQFRKCASIPFILIWFYSILSMRYRFWQTPSMSCRMHYFILLLSPHWGSRITGPWRESRRPATHPSKLVSWPPVSSVHSSKISGVDPDSSVATTLDEFHECFLVIYHHVYHELKPP